MRADITIKPRLMGDGADGTYGIIARAEITFTLADGTQITGSHLDSPGLWGVAGYADDHYLEGIALEQMDELASMLVALGVPVAVVARAMPDEVEFAEVIA